jgi:hypothetical protein
MYSLSAYHLNPPIWIEDNDRGEIITDSNIRTRIKKITPNDNLGDLSAG